MACKEFRQMKKSLNLARPGNGARTPLSVRRNVIKTRVYRAFSWRCGCLLLLLRSRYRHRDLDHGGKRKVFRQNSPGTATIKKARGDRAFFVGSSASPLF